MENTYRLINVVIQSNMMVEPLGGLPTTADVLPFLQENSDLSLSTCRKLLFYKMSRNIPSFNWS